jgi:endonuclease-3
MEIWYAIRMHKKEKARKIQKILNELFPSPTVPLTHRDPYTLLIAVILSAQCTDARVNTITPLLFAKASTPQQMITLTPLEIATVIKPCGLGSTKAKAIWQLSKDLIEKYEGHVPQTFEELETLPGVGHKTASVVMTQAFHVPAFPVDTHIHRLAKRWGLSPGKNVKQTEKDLKALFPKSSWNKMHLQMIYYARAYCPARGHQIEHCPICNAIS